MASNLLYINRIATRFMATGSGDILTAVNSSDTGLPLDRVRAARTQLTERFVQFDRLLAAAISRQYRGSEPQGKPLAS